VRRFFTAPENISDDMVVLTGSDVAHIRTVLRLKPGDDIHVLDGKGNCYRVALTDVRNKEVVGRILSREEVDVESPLTVRMGLALLKGNKFDDIISQAVELGVTSLVPLSMERCVARVAPADLDKKTRRWNTIAMEASKQCGRTIVPLVDSIQTLESFCKSSEHCELKIVFWENEGATRLNGLADVKRAQSVAFITGPEGGFVEAEVVAARKHGFKTVSLGPRTLRAETAPVAVIAILQNLLGDM
jgi:16S rRNA (uracil1498-N3)-methyltransferase